MGTSGSGWSRSGIPSYSIGTVSAQPARAVLSGICSTRGTHGDAAVRLPPPSNAFLPTLLPLPVLPSLPSRAPKTLCCLLRARPQCYACHYGPTASIDEHSGPDGECATARQGEGAIRQMCVRACACFSGRTKAQSTSSRRDVPHSCIGRSYVGQRGALPGLWQSAVQGRPCSPARRT